MTFSSTDYELHHFWTETEQVIAIITIGALPSFVVLTVPLCKVSVIAVN